MALVEAAAERAVRAESEVTREAAALAEEEAEVLLGAVVEGPDASAAAWVLAHRSTLLEAKGRWASASAAVVMAAMRRVSLLETIDSLAEAINAFAGGCVLVSHDMRLITQVAKQIWEVRDGGVYPFNATMDDYKKQLLEHMEVGE